MAEEFFCVDRKNEIIGQDPARSDARIAFGNGFSSDFLVFVHFERFKAFLATGCFSRPLHPLTCLSAAVRYEGLVIGGVFVLGVRGYWASGFCG